MTDIPTFRVTCHTPDDTDPDRRLEGLGGLEQGGWWADIDSIISALRVRKYHLWTTTPEGQSVWVIVAQRNGREYLKTQADGVEPNNLLALQACGGR